MLWALIGCNIFWLFVLWIVTQPSNGHRTWEVTVEPYGGGYEERYHSSRVSVRVQRIGIKDYNKRFLIGQVDPMDPEFENKLAQLKAEAADRADTLHATGVR